MDTAKMAAFKQTAPLSNTCWPQASQVHKRQASDFLLTYNASFVDASLRASEMGQKKEESLGRPESKKFSDTYSMRRQGVLEKKQKL